ncbi:putative Integrin-linked protein kinase, partial [Cardiosporidium cionae]
VYHLNLKAKNVLLDDSLNAKLTDFGVSHILDCFDVLDRQLIEETAFSKNFFTENGCLEFPHPYNWCAPEVLKENRRLGFDESSDVYSFGILFLEMLSSAIPFQTLTAAQVMGCVGYAKAKPADCCTYEILKDIFDKATHYDSKKRISFEEIVKLLDTAHEEMLYLSAETALLAFMGDS